LANFRAQPANAATRKKLGLKDDELAFELSWVNQWKNRPTSLLQDGDVIVAINGNRNSLTVGTFTAYLFREASGQTLRLTLIREGQEKKLDVKIP
jgi:type II secretory pathway component PulC